MFFLGISAHLFIYLLVPAFLIVCFYFRGAKGSPEVAQPLPNVIVYEYKSVVSSERTYVYRIEKQQVTVSQKTIVIPDTVSVVALFGEQFNFYLSPFIPGKALRAPPAIH